MKSSGNTAVHHRAGVMDRMDESGAAEGVKSLVICAATQFARLMYELASAA